MYNASEDPDLIRIPCHTLITGDRFYFAYKTSRRQEAGIQMVRQWIRQRAASTGLLDAIREG